MSLVAELRVGASPMTVQSRLWAVTSAPRQCHRGTLAAYKETDWSCGSRHRLQFDGKTEIGETLDEAMGLRLGAAAREVIGAEIFIQRAVLEHVVSGGEDRGGDGADRLLGAAPSAQPHELRPQVGCLGASGCPCALDQHILEPGGSLAQAGRPPLVGTFVIARAQAGPRPQVPGRGEPLHVGADLGQDDLGAQFADPRDRAQLLDRVTKAGERGIGLPVDVGDAGIKGVDLLQMQPEQETMLALDAPAQASRSVAAEARTLGCASAASLAGSVSPSINASIIARPLRPITSESTDSSLMLASSNVL